MPNFILRIGKNDTRVSKVRNPPGRVELVYEHRQGDLMHNVHFRVWITDTAPAPRLEAAEGQVLFVHGHAPLMTIGNCLDLAAQSGNFTAIKLDEQSRQVLVIKDFCHSLDTYIYED